MTTINLKDFYYWYIQDQFIEVSEEVAEALRASVRYEAAKIAPYMVVMNSHDVSSRIKVAMTPVRVVCQNTLNLALNSAKRTWATKHTEYVMNRVPCP